MNHRQPKVHIDFFDTTLRDGAQSLPAEHQFPEGSKSAIADHIARLGIGVIEAGFPATPGDKEEVMEVAKSVGQTNYDVQVWDSSVPTIITRPPIIAGLARSVPKDVEATWEAVSSAKHARIHTFISTDPEHMSAKFPGKTSDQVLAIGSEAIRRAKALSKEHTNASVEFSAEAASTTDLRFLEKVVRDAVQQGADIINLPDTVGQRDPFWMYSFYKKAIEWVMNENPSVTISAHNHDDLGAAVSNTFALVKAASDYTHEHGVDVNIQLESTISGIGERAGNADIFPVVANIFKHAPDLATAVNFKFNPQNSVKIARAVMRFANMQVPRQSPIVGEDINTHRSGIHSDGILKGGHGIYTPFDPMFWGHDASAVHENGKYQGSAGKKAVIQQEERPKSEPWYRHTPPFPL